MKSKLIILFLLSIIFCFSMVCLATDMQYGKIIISIIDFRNNTGDVRVALFNTERGFPDQPEHAFKKIKLSISNKQALASFEQIPYGTYAVGILHDENKDGKFNMRLFIPKEGYGASNDAKGKFGPPKFNDAKFELNSTEKTLVIHVSY